MNNIPKNTLVLITANTSNPFDSFKEKIWVNDIVITRNIPKISKEKLPVADVIMKNQNEKPAVTANALNLGDDNSI